MKFFNTIRVDKAKELLRENFKDLIIATEAVDILKSKDRILAKDIYSAINVPEFNRSTVDGYAILTKDSHGSTTSIPAMLNVVGKVKMGEYINQEINAGQAMYVPTGGMNPRGADGVIMIEDVELIDEETLLLYKPISNGSNIILKGDDIKKDELTLDKGTRLNPEHIGVLASLGISKVEVYEKIKFYIISTGDEIIDIDEELTIGKVRDINAYTLAAMIEDIGGEVVGKNIINDDYELLRREVDKALDIAHMVLISGGSSVGTMDYTHKVIDSFQGKGVFVHGLSIKPGKPTIIGEGKNKPIIGLPGHPISSIVVFKAIVEEFIENKLGQEIIKSTVHAILDSNFPSSPGKETYHMVKLRKEKNKYIASPVFGKSGMISLMAKSNGYIIIEDHEEGIYKGEERQIYLF